MDLRWAAKMDESRVDKLVGKMEKNLAACWALTRAVMLVVQMVHSSVGKLA